jgi:Tol biopolymer transport system component
MSVDVSPDGSTMVFDLLGDIYTVPMAGGKATRIIGGNSVDTQPRFSPDGRSLVFISDRNGSDATWPADADGRRARLLTNGGVYPVWTPDGRQIVTGRRARPHSPPDTPSSTRRKWRFDFLSPTTDHSCRPRQLDDFQAGGFLAR